jgi:hypothetical protein
MQGVRDLKLLYRDFPDLWKELKRLNQEVIKNIQSQGGEVYEFKQMSHNQNTLKQWEERFKKEIEFEKRETSLF